MPRSSATWASRRRLEFIDDILHGQGYITRPMIMDQFKIDPSLASMDLSAYGHLVPLGRAKAGDVMDDGSTLVGKKKGGMIAYVPDGPRLYAPHDAAWPHLSFPVANHADWFSAVMTAWREDHPLASADDVRAYFGVGDKVARGVLEVFTGRDPNAERAAIWSMFQ